MKILSWNKLIFFSNNFFSAFIECINEYTMNITLTVSDFKSSVNGE